MTTISARDFNRHAGAAMRAADDEVVVITENGRPSHVLMSIEAYERLRGRTSLHDALAMPEADGVEFTPARLEFTAQSPDLG